MKKCQWKKSIFEQKNVSSKSDFASILEIFSKMLFIFFEHLTSGSSWPTDQGDFQESITIQNFWNGPSDGPVGYHHGFPASPEVIVGRFGSIPSSGGDLAHPRSRLWLDSCARIHPRPGSYSRPWVLRSSISLLNRSNWVMLDLGYTRDRSGPVVEAGIGNSGPNLKSSESWYFPGDCGPELDPEVKYKMFMINHRLTKKARRNSN